MSTNVFFLIEKCHQKMTSKYTHFGTQNEIQNRSNIDPKSSLIDSRTTWDAVDAQKSLWRGLRRLLWTLK